MSSRSSVVEEEDRVPTGYRCAVCGLSIDGEAEPIGGVYGKGFRHADYAICAEQLRGVDPYAD